MEGEQNEHGPGDRPASENGGITRRRFLFYSGAGGAMLALRDAFTVEALAQGLGVPAGPATLTRTARRREDFLALTFEFRNLKLDNSKPKRLVKQVANQPAYLVVVFPPQHLSDEAREVDELLAPGDTPARLAGPSRLAFEVPSTVLPMAFNLETLLSWTLLPQRVVAGAGTGPGPAALVEPASHETAIELPWFLVLSPRPDAGWAHQRKPVTFGNRTELWHTRLGTRVPLHVDGQGHLVPAHIDEFDDANRTVRAVWARDAQFPTRPPPDPEPPAPPPPRFSLTPDQRWQIVGQSTKQAGRRPIQVNRLMLSSLGGWLDSRGLWDPAPGGEYSVEEWRHRAVMGRDSYVRVVERGFLMPFGHRAAKVTIVERQFRTVPGQPQGAYAVLREYIVVRQPFKEYGAQKAKHQPNDGRGFPFRSVRITTLTTPDLETNGAPYYFPVTDIGEHEVLFDLVGVDWEGRATEFEAPLMWVSQFALYGDPDDPDNVDYPVPLATLTSAYNNTNVPSRRKRKAHGQKVAFAPPNEPGDTSFPVEELVFAVQQLAAGQGQNLQDLFDELKDLGEPPFFPLLEEASVRLSAAAEAAGELLGLARVAIDEGFIENAFDEVKNAGQMFLKTLGDTVGIDFSDAADKAGAILTPNFDVAGLSRLIGPAGGVLEDLRNGTFDPKTFFGLDAKLLGSLKLQDVIKLVDGLQEPKALGEKGPRLQTVLVPKPPELPKKVVTRLDWTPDLGDGDPLGIFDPGTDGSLTLKAEATTDLFNPDDSTWSVEGLLRNIRLRLIGKDNAFLILEVKQVKFTAGKGKPPDIDPQIGKVEFTGPLTFVEEMKNFLSSLGKGYGIDVQPSYIEAALSLPLPSISVGVFTLQNISIGLGATIPFTGDPARFRFAFCSRENPFILTVAMFGGGGFFGIECGTDKSVMLELSLEFGAAVAFDIGVASGGAEIMAGIYIKVENDDALLSGFLRAAGELDILGLIRISCEIYLGFEYHLKSDKCVGEARFYLEIEIFGFITIPVKAQVRRAFGGEGDPTFAQLMAPSEWTEYCNAYAPLVNA